MPQFSFADLQKPIEHIDVPTPIFEKDGLTREKDEDGNQVKVTFRVHAPPVERCEEFHRWWLGDGKTSSKNLLKNSRQTTYINCMALKQCEIQLVSDDGSIEDLADDSFEAIRVLLLRTGGSSGPLTQQCLAFLDFGRRKDEDEEEEEEKQEDQTGHILPTDSAFS